MAHYNPNVPNMLGIQTVTPPHHHNLAAMQFANAQQQRNNANAASDDAQEDSGEEATPILIKIITPLIITGDNNLIAVDPSVQAAKIAMAVVSAMKQMSAGSAGVPMIDENGRPRQVTVEIQAEIKVEGSKNIIGEKAVLSTVSGKREEGQGTKDGRKREREREDGESADTSAKRVKNE